jgi:hypothetical protein
VRPHQGEYALYADPMNQITDQLGVRVITYTRDDARRRRSPGRACDRARHRDWGQRTASEGRFCYATLSHSLSRMAVQPDVTITLRLEGAARRFG